MKNKCSIEHTGGLLFLVFLFSVAGSGWFWMMLGCDNDAINSKELFYLAIGTFLFAGWLAGAPPDDNMLEGTNRMLASLGGVIAFWAFCLFESSTRVILALWYGAGGIFLCMAVAFIQNRLINPRFSTRSWFR